MPHYIYETKFEDITRHHLCHHHVKVNLCYFHLSVVNEVC